MTKKVQVNHCEVADRIEAVVGKVGNWVAVSKAGDSLVVLRCEVLESGEEIGVVVEDSKVNRFGEWVSTVAVSKGTIGSLESVARWEYNGKVWRND